MEKIVVHIKDMRGIIQAQTRLLELQPNLKDGKEFDCTIEQHREKRSKNANDYSWTLQDRMAKILNRTITDVHNQMVLDYGVIETYSIRKDAFESACRMFDYYQILGEGKVNDKEFVHVKAGLGTHLYNTLEMSKFIDGVVQEAKELGIETKTPQELSQLKSLWDSGKR